MKEPLPVDRGWAWVICASVFMMALLTLTGGQVNSIGFLDMVATLDTTVTTLAISVTVQLFAASIFALVTVNLLVPRFGERPVIFTGVMVAACSSIGLSQSPNVIVFILFSLCKGAAAGSYFVPCIALVGHYFNKRRSIATTVSICGTSVAAIAAPRVVRLCVDEFGIRGTYLLLAAVELHMLIFALLLRPVSSYGPPLPEPTDAKTGKDVKEQPEAELQLLPADSKPKNPKLDDLRKLRSVSFDYDEAIPEEPSLEKSDVYSLPYIDGDDTSQGKGTPHQNVRSHDPESNGKPAAAQGGVTDRDGAYEEIDRPNFSRSLSTVSSTSIKSKGSRRPPPLERRQSVWSMMSEGQGSQAGTAAPVDFDDKGSSPLAKKEEEKQPSGNILNRVFDVTLFREWRFCFLAFGDLLASSNTYMIAYFPTMVVIQGATKDEAATLQTIMGCVDLMGRLVAGFVADLDKVRPSQVSAIGMICLAVMCHLSPAFTTFKAMIGMSLGLGLFIGVRQSLSPVIYTEVMGLARMSKSFSVSILMIAGGAAAHSAFLSAIMESADSTRFVWHYIGTVLAIYAVILFCLPMIHRAQLKFKGQTPPENETKPERPGEAEC